MDGKVTKQLLYVFIYFIVITEVILLIVPLTASPTTSANYAKTGWLSIAMALTMLFILYLGGVVKSLDKTLPLWKKLKHLLYKSLPGILVLSPVVLLSYLHLKYNQTFIKNPEAVSSQLQSLTVVPLIGQTISFFNLLMLDLDMYDIEFVRKQLYDRIMTLIQWSTFMSAMFFSIMQYYSVTQLATDGFTS